jgi:hypothetical protein
MSRNEFATECALLDGDVWMHLDTANESDPLPTTDAIGATVLVNLVNSSEQMPKIALVSGFSGF